MFARRPRAFICWSIVFTLFALVLSACAAGSAPAYQEAPPVAPAPAASPREFAAEESGSGYASSIPGQEQTVERIVIKNASLTLAVVDPPKSMVTIMKMAEEMGGYVVSASQDKQTLSSGVEVPRASVTIRVPAERLNEALERIKAESGQDPVYETINSEDVTKEYVDLQSRLHNLESAEKQLSQIMDEARKTEDVLSVYNQLVSVREQIEVIKGQIKYYDESAALSSISTELLAEESLQPLSIGGWQPVGVARDAVQTLINTLKALANIVIWIVIYILPVLLILYLIFVLPLSLVFRAWRKRRRAQKQAQAQPPSTPAS